MSEAKFKTCICGKVCKGRAAFANHARKCEMETARSWAFVRAVELGKRPVSHATFAEAWARGWRPPVGEGFGEVRRGQDGDR